MKRWPIFDEEQIADVVEVLRSGRVNAWTGDHVKAFERAYARSLGRRHAVALANGSVALDLAMRVLGIGPGDEVIVPTYTFIATAEAVSTAGATPRLVDVDPETALITAEIVEAAITPRTRAVIPVHLFGRPVEMDPIVELCRARGIAVIEDACQAHGARYRGRRVGSIADAGCFSFYPTKNLGGWGDGGALVTGDSELAEKVRLLRSHGEATRNHHELVTGTHRLDALQAAILEVKLRHLDDWNEKRRTAAATLSAELAGSGLTLPTPAAPDSDNVFHLYVIRTLERDALRSHLDRYGVASGIHYPTPIHLQPAYADLGLGPGSLPVAERLAAECCSLPIFPAIEDAQIAETVAAVRSFGAAGNS